MIDKKEGFQTMLLEYVNISSKLKAVDIDLIFPGWSRQSERVCVMSPHDDDAIIGAGYAIEASIINGAEVFILIFCRGNAGYSIPGEMEKTEAVRRKETVNAYRKLGIKEENILRLDYSDFSILTNIGWQLANGSEGSFKKILTELRRHKITRVLVPNHYREHIDHVAVSIIGSYDSPQAGDPILADWYGPHTVKSVLEYSVWADLSPEDSLVSGRAASLRANRLIIVPEEIEKKVNEGILEYKSQSEIIKGLVASRSERKIDGNRFIEVYLSFNPRPKLDYGPYKRFVSELK